MELYQRKGADGSLLTPYWYYDLTVDGRRVRKSTKERTKAKAQRVMHNALTEADKVASSGPPEITLRDAMIAYMDNLKVRGRRTDGRMMLTDKTFAMGKWASMKTFGLSEKLLVSQVNESHIEKLKVARMSEGAAVGTIGYELKVIRAAVILAGRQGNARPFNLKFNIPTPPSKTRWLTIEEWQRVYEALDPMRPWTLPTGVVTTAMGRVLENRVSARDVFVALTMCGGRWAEVCKMTTDQVILDEATGTVRVRLFGWKTGKERMVPAPPMMAEVLKRRAKLSQSRGTPYLFPATKRDRTNPVKGWFRSSRSIKEAMGRAGVNETHIVERLGTATVHSLRHTFASWLRQAGMSIGDIQELLGHEAESMTKRYAHIAPNATVDTASQVLTAKLNQALGGGTMAAHKEVGLIV